MNTWKMLLILLLPLSAVLAQEPHFVNAKLERRPAARNLDKEFQSLVTNQVEPAWIGYAARSVEGQHHICGSGYTNPHIPSILQHAACKLEGPNQGMNFQVNRDKAVGSNPQHILVLSRVENKSVGRIRIFSEDCELDAGGLTVFWLTDVRPAESIEWLSTFVPLDEDKFRETRHRSETAIAAIALHADSTADRALEGFIDAKQPEIVRRNVAFWLGNVRGQKGYEILRRLVREDASDKVREQCVFALSLTKVPAAVNAMIDAARNDKSAKVRGHALFWLSQKAGQQAADAISEAVANDPETAVKKKAVFALSQLPKDEGIPKLIQLARTNKNPDVRKDAMFWLGQSKDDRALAFFEEVLTSR